MDDPAQLSEYGKILIILLVGIILVSMTIFLGKLISPKKPNATKNSTYECGEVPQGSAWVQFNPRFYVIALVFLLFDVELIFIFPWATVFGQADLIQADGRWGWFTLIEMAIFLAILIIGLIFVWVKGDLEWVKPQHKLPQVKTGIPASAYQAINQAVYQVKDHLKIEIPELVITAEVDKPISKGFTPRFKKKDN